MKKQYKVSIALILVSMMVGSALAQTGMKPTADLSADEIIKKSVAASNPKAAADKIKSRVTKGTISVPAHGINGTIEAYAKWPNNSYSLANLTGIGEFL